MTTNLWVRRFPQTLFGAQIGRTVTIIRLTSGELLIHSTAPFGWEDVAAIRGLGRPAWLMEATLFHDTFAKAGRTAFPEIPYYVPEGFRRVPGGTLSLRAAPEAWAAELHVLPIEGMPSVREHVLLHRPTRTLVAADLVFNFGPVASPWTRLFFRWAGGIRVFPGVSRLFRMSIRSQAAFAKSIQQMMAWDFDRLIVGHGEIIESDGKAKLAAALARAGL